MAQLAMAQVAQQEKIWRSPFSTSLARAGCAFVTVGHEIHIMGGFDSNRQETALDLPVLTTVPGSLYLFFFKVFGGWMLESQANKLPRRRSEGQMTSEDFCRTVMIIKF